MLNGTKSAFPIACGLCVLHFLLTPRRTLLVQLRLDGLALCALLGHRRLGAALLRLAAMVIDVVALGRDLHLALAPTIDATAGSSRDDRDHDQRSDDDGDDCDG